MTMSKILEKLRKENKDQYRILGICIFLSILLVSSYAMMYFSPTIQKMLPEGGDTRKLCWLMFGVTVAGCTIFTIYGASLFFKYKSREFGVLLALGERKRQLAGCLARELAAVILGYTLLGVIGAFPISFLIWKGFQALLLDARNLRYSISMMGIAAGVLFACLLACCICAAGYRFIRRADIMEILKTQRKSEIVKDIRPWTGKLGMACVIIGLALAMAVPPIWARVFHHQASPLWNGAYLISAAGLYLFLLGAVGRAKKGRYPEKYYKNIISTNLMRFTARQTTKNMCVIAMLIFVLLISAFWGMSYYDSAFRNGENAPVDYSLHYPAAEQQITKEEIYDLAARHGVEITDYKEAQAAELLITYAGTELSDDGEYYDVKREKYATFLSASVFSRIAGKQVSLKPGEYKAIVQQRYQEEIWAKPECLLKVESPAAGEKMKPAYKGTVRFDNLTRVSDPFAFILSDADYASYTAALTEDNKVDMVFFNVKDVMDTYPFAKELEEEYIAHATDISDHYFLYDAREEELAEKAGEPYAYSGRVGMTADNPELLQDWKYAPVFKVLTKGEVMQMIAVFVLLSAYIAIIALAAIGVMTYVRSITIAVDNRQLFEDMKKLGASRDYETRVVKVQLRKIFLYPGIGGCGISLVFTILMLFFNDMRLEMEEVRLIGIESIMIGASAIFLYVLYRISFGKMRSMLDL